MFDLDYWLKDNVLVSFFVIFIVAYIYFNVDLFGTRLLMGEYAKPLLFTVIVLLTLIVFKTLMDSYCSNNKKYIIKNNNRNNYFSDQSNSSSSDTSTIFLRNKA